MLLISLSIVAKDRVILNPAYEVSTSGITHITKIIIKKNETQVYIHSTFLPHWWVKFSKKHFIKDTKSGTKLYATTLIGGEFDKEINMSASGDSSFVLIFPALGKATTRVDFGEEEKTIIFGISLDAKQKKEQQVPQVPLAAQQWMKAELVKAKVKTLVDYSSPKFFSHDTARLVGYIKGYDPRMDFNTGMIYSNNVLTREDIPVVVRIHDDGRFEADIPMVHPEYTFVTFKEQMVKFYLEPGQTLAMVLNWDEFLVGDRLRHIRHTHRDVEFRGPASLINMELLNVAHQQQDYRGLTEKVKTLSPDQFKTQQMAIWNKGKEGVEEHIKSRNLTAQTRSILRNEVAMSNAVFMFEFLSMREYELRKDAANPILNIQPERSYYDFLTLLPLNDQSLLVTSDFSTFINRFEFSPPIIRVMGSGHVKPLHEYLFGDLKLTPSAKDLAYFEAHNTFGKKLNAGISDSEKSDLIKGLNGQELLLKKRYQSYIPGYEAKYPSVATLNTKDRELQLWHEIDLVVANYYGLKPNLVYEVAKLRSLKHNFENRMKKEEAQLFLKSFEKGLTNPFLAKEAMRIFNKSYPVVPAQAYNLPSGRATEIFRKIIDPYKGKMLFVDFWGIFCGPCIGSIKNNKASREKFKGSKDLEFIFITSKEDSPLERYNAFIEEQKLTNTHRLSGDDYRYLRQLFKFNGIPRYVLVNREGQIVNDDFPMHNFEALLGQLIPNRGD